MTGVLPVFPQVVDGNLDPTTFVTTVTDSTPEVYVVYLLGAGFNGPVNATWTDTDSGKSFVETAAAVQNPNSGPSWSWFSNNVAGGWLADGHYAVQLTFGPTGETVAVPFTITPAAVVPSAATDSVASAGTGSLFALVGLASSVDSSRQSIDRSAFATSFPADTQTIYIEVTLASGRSGEVDVHWVSPDGKTSSDSNTYPAGGPWIWFGLDVAGNLAPGTNTVSLTFVPTGDKVTLPFTITNGAGASSTSALPASPVATGSAFTLLRLSTSGDASRPAPDPSTFTDSYTSSSPAFQIDFELRHGLTGTVTCTVTRDGDPILDAPLSMDYTAGYSWGNFEIDSPGSWRTGDYLATLTYKPTGETATITITVK